MSLQEYGNICEQIADLSFRLNALRVRKAELENELNASLSAAVSGPNGASPAGTSPSSSTKQFDPDRPPPLTHTKLISAKIAGSQIPESKWNALLGALVGMAKTKAGADQTSLRKFLSVPFVIGRKEIEGYHFLPQAGLSVQGQDTNHAWIYSLYTARQLGVAIEVEFEWRAKNGAAFPGQRGTMSA